jgi:hypothetical protein
MGLLKVSTADLVARNLCCDSKNRDTAAMAIKKPVNKVEVSWTATAGTDSDLVREMCLGTCRKSGRLLMAYM